MPRHHILLLALSIAAAAPAAAQGAAPDTTLAARVQAFLREIPREPNDALAAFFPRRVDWTWVQTLRPERGGPPRTGIWRFPGAEAARAIGADGPACPSFDVGGGEFGPFEGRFGMQALLHRGPWRRVRGNRYVPPGAPASSPVFVEWQLEDGEWVVSTFGDQDIHLPGLPEPPRGPFVRDATPVAEDARFAPRDWHTIAMEGRRLPRYGRARALDRAELARIGHLHGVNVYVERTGRGEEEGFVYLPVAPGEYQPYERPLPTPCR